MVKDGLKVGSARVSTDAPDLRAQRGGLERLGIPGDRVYVDHGRTGKNLDRPGLDQALAACREGDTLVVTKLGRLARSIRGAHDIADELEKRQIALSIGGSVYDPADPVGKLLFNVPEMVTEFEHDLIGARTREGMAVAKSRGRRKGRQPKLNAAQQKQVVRLMAVGEMSSAEIGELFGVSRQTVYRVSKAKEDSAA